MEGGSGFVVCGKALELQRCSLHHLQEPRLTVYWEHLAKTEAASCSSLGISLRIQEGPDSVMMLVLGCVCVFTILSIHLYFNLTYYKAGL